MSASQRLLAGLLVVGVMAGVVVFGLTKFVVGTLRKPAFWESTAVPELRQQAAIAARRALELVSRPNLAMQPLAERW